MLRPTPIMEGALLRRLRARRALGARGVAVQFREGGGVGLWLGSTLLCTCRWTGECFQVIAHGTIIFESHTVAGASAFLNSFFEEDEHSH